MTIVLASTDAMPGLAQLIEQRRLLGQDGYDEVWDGVYHVAAMASSAHGDVQAQLIVSLSTLAVAKGLAVSGPVSLGLSEHDHRVPDVVVVRERLDVVWVPTAAIVVDVLAPGHETYAKFNFYYARGVEEILVADPAKRAVTLFRRGAAAFEETDMSAVLDAPLAAIAAGITWP
jgi:Putative restriction endonuclease